MSTLIKLVMVGCLVWFSQLAQAIPSLKLPFPAGESWEVTRLYEDATHKNYNNGPYSDDRYAIDFAFGGCDATYGKPIVAVASGTVQGIKRTEIQTPVEKGYGNSIVVKLDGEEGWFTRYAHLSAIDSSVAEEGEKRFVKQGQVIGYAGGTGHVEGSKCTKPGIPSGVQGVHLHFVLCHSGSGVKPEPMGGYSGFIVGTRYTSNNTPQSPAMSQPAISCVYASSSQQFCWKSANATPASCSKASAWVLYDYNNNVAYNKAASDCVTYCLASNNFCKDVSGSLSVGGFGNTSDSFNLKQDTDILDLVTGVEWIAGEKVLGYNQVVKIRTEVKAKDGDALTHMRAGKDTIEVDFYVRQDDDDWTRISRQYIQAKYLGSGHSQTVTVNYTIPAGVLSVSFKVKIDAEDEAYESNEGDNWSRIETFDVFPLAAVLDIILDD